jgi:hypothetical protein
MSISGFGKNIACEPYAVKDVDTKSFGSGDKTFKVHTGVFKGLIPLKVVYGLAHEGILPGDFVYVRQDGVVSAWTKDVEIEGGPKVVLVGMDQVLLVDRKNRVAWSPLPTPVPK